MCILNRKPVPIHILNLLLTSILRLEPIFKNNDILPSFCMCDLLGKVVAWRITLRLPLLPSRFLVRNRHHKCVFNKKNTVGPWLVMMLGSKGPNASSREMD